MDAESTERVTHLEHDLAWTEAAAKAEINRLKAALETAVTDRETKAKAELWDEAIFGSFDGLTSVTGTILALLGKSASAIVLAAIGLAVASACGMAAGEWLSDEEAGGRLNRAATMGAATAVGTMVPAAPFFLLPKGPALAVAGGLAVVLAMVIGRVRHRGWKGYAQTFGTLTAAGGVTMLVALAIPAGVG